MAFDFPNSPTVGQQFTPVGGPTYQWNGTGWTLVGAPTAGMLNQQVFTASGTYTPTPGMQTAVIECVGGGGGGSGVIGASTNYATNSGGGSGGYSRKFVTAAQVGTSQVVTIGAGGAGGAAGANAGGPGGDTSVGTLCIARGARAPANYANNGLGGLPGIGDIAAAGTPGGGAANTIQGQGGAAAGAGGSSIFGGGAAPNQYNLSGNGNNATSYGSGGSGASSALTANYAGGNGSPGIVIITEYANVSTGVASGATSHTGGFINKFRNGMMDVAQRGPGITVAANSAAYTLDGWLVSTAGVSVGCQQQYNVNLSSNALRLVCATGLTTCNVQQRIESNIAVQLLNNNKTAQPITVQFTIYNNSGASITPQLNTYFPTARDNFAGLTADLATVNLQSIANGAIGVVSYTFTPSASCQFGYLIQLLFAGQLNAASGYVDISYADIRATPGLPTGLNNNPPPVEMRPIQQELAYCQRYYYDPANGGSSTIFYQSIYANGSGTFGLSSLFFPVTMRSAATIVIRNQSYVNATAVSAAGPTTAGFIPQITASAAGQAVAQFNITASAEL